MSKAAGKPSSLDASLLGVPAKGTAAADRHALEQPTAGTAPVESPALAGPEPTRTAPGPSEPSPALSRVEPEPEAAPRTGITIRVLNTDSERLRTLAYQTKRKKQYLLDLAIKEYLDRNGV